MFRVQTTCATGIVVAVLLCAGSPAVGFNPQPEPPANQWGVEGFIDMTALTTAPTGAAMPFGVDSEIIGDDHVDFHAGIRASFIASDNDGDLKPDDGVYTATTGFFDVFVGDTRWSHTMFTRDFDFQLQRGVVTGVRGVFPASPGEWVATDERFGDNLGTISGTHALRDSVVPEPSSLSLLAIGVLMLICRRWKR